MMNYKQSLTFSYFVGSGAVLTDPTKTTADLAPLQLGLFNNKNYQAIPAGTSIQSVPEIIIAMGSPNEEKITWVNATQSFKSIPVRGSRLISYRKATPKTALNHKVAIGFDGVSDCKTITADCDRTYSLNLQIEGSPATRFFGPKPLTQTYVYNTGCCTDCLSGCSADVEKMVDTFVTQINNDPRISPFIKAEKLVTYITPPADFNTLYTVYTLTIADEGDINSLAAVQVTYGDVSIKRISRNGVYSTYEIISNGGTPSAFTTQAATTIPNCTDCPSGYVLTPAYDKIKVQIADEGVNISTTLSALTNVVSATKIVGDASTGTYILLADGTVTINALSGAVVTPLGKTTPVCTLDSAITTAWVEVGQVYKAARELCVTIGDLPCHNPSGQAILDEMVEFYSGFPDVITESITEVSGGICANRYSLLQMSKNYLSGECGVGVAEYTTVAPFRGFSLQECCINEVTPGVVDKIGITLTGAYIDTKFSRCSFKYDDFVELDLPRIYVRQGDFVALEEGKCADAWPVTLLQAPQYPTGLGEFVLREYIETMQFKGQRWSDDPRWREVYGFNYDFIKTNKQYKQFYLEFEALDKYQVNIGYGGNDMKTTLVFAFEDGVDTTAFETILEGWISSARPDLIDADPHDNLYR
jgi:hypothetical protein